MGRRKNDRGTSRTPRAQPPRRPGRPKVCLFCKERIAWVDSKDTNVLRRPGRGGALHGPGPTESGQDRRVLAPVAAAEDERATTTAGVEVPTTKTCWPRDGTTWPGMSWAGSPPAPRLAKSR